MAVPPGPVCWANKRGAVAIAVAVAPVASMVRLVEAIIDGLVDRCARILAQFILGLKGRMPVCGPVSKPPAAGDLGHRAKQTLRQVLSDGASFHYPSPTQM